MTKCDCLIVRITDLVQTLKRLLDYMGEISPGKEIGIYFFNFADFMRSNVMNSAIFFHYPYVRFRVHKYEQIYFYF